jgi:putative transposase
MNSGSEHGYKTFGRNRSRRLPGFDYSAPYVYLVTVATHDRSDVFDTYLYADAALECLRMCRDRYGHAVYAFCLMRDHLHLLLTPGKSGFGIPQFVGAFKSLSTRAFWQCGGSERLWQRHYHDHILRSEEGVLAVAEYVLDNPVRSGLAASRGEYRYAGTMDDVPA